MQYVVLLIQHFVDDISSIITGLYGFTLIFHYCILFHGTTNRWASQAALVVKNLPADAGDMRVGGSLSLTKEARIYNGLKTISLTSGTGKSGQPLVKEWN